MFSFDVETTGLDSTACILSLGCVYYDGTYDLTYQSLIDGGIFIKFDAMEQMRYYKRTKTDSTLEWWKKQNTEAKQTNLLPGKSDMNAVDGMRALEKWFKSKPDFTNDVVWARGGLDQMCLESLLRAIDIKPFISYASWRDTRTGIECFYPQSKNGYVAVDPSVVSDYNRDNVVKHHPLHDAASDLCMLVGGVA